MRGLAHSKRSTAPSNGMDAKSSAGVPLSSPAAAQRCAEGAGLDSGAAAAAQSAMPSIAAPCHRTDRQSFFTNAAAIGEYNFAGQYQQSPAPLGGGLVKAEWFKRYRENELPERFDRIVQSWDTANKATELSDFSVCTTWGVKGKDLFLLGVFRRRLEYPALKRAVREQQSLFAASEVLIEDKASGTQLIQELIVEGCHGVTRYEPTTEKIMRLHAQTAIIENGFVHIPETAPWLAEYLHEMTVFPKGKHDDQVDSTAQFLDWFKKPFPGQGIFEYYRRLAQEAEERRKPQPVQTTWAIGSMEWQAMQKSS